MLQALVEAPESDTPWIALRHSIEPLAAAYAQDEARSRQLAPPATGHVAEFLHIVEDLLVLDAVILDG